MTTVGFIGSGMIGGTVARLAIAGGYDVVMSNSRGPETLADTVAALGPHARAATGADAAAAGDLVVVSTPLAAIDGLPADQLAGKPVLDTINYYAQRDGNEPDLDAGTTTSSELLQRRLPRSHVVKVFNNIYFMHLGALARPAGAPDRTALPIAGDDADAKAAVAAFLDAIGYDAVDAGPLAAGRTFQAGSAPAYGAPYGPFDNPDGTPADATTIRAALAAGS
ncbi:MAG TPA: NAD(P)-binding domain-containing protein [Micromonosporaceae bacterium]|nr:NAD(P)-binding domain-containing protein [Micromonosporaceae bacterium]